LVLQAQVLLAALVEADQSPISMEVLVVQEQLVRVLLAVLVGIKLAPIITCRLAVAAVLVLLVALVVQLLQALAVLEQRLQLQAHL
jgi:hypothetical protein